MTFDICRANLCRMGVTPVADQSPGSLTLRFRAAWVRDRLKKVGFDRIEDLAQAAGISRQQLQRLLANECLPSKPTSRGLAKALRCLEDDLTEEVAAEEEPS